MPEMKPYELNLEDANTMGIRTTKAVQTLVNILQSNGTITGEQATTVIEVLEGIRN